MTSNHIKLPWNSDPRRVTTGLARRSAAVIDWLATVQVDDIDGVIGFVPSTVLRTIDARMKGP